MYQILIIPVISNSCDYFNEDTLFVDSFLPNSCSICLSFFNINISSLPKHFDQFKCYLQLQNFAFSKIGISETCLKNLDMPFNLYSFRLSTIGTCNRENKVWGGGGLYVSIDLHYDVRHEFSKLSNFIESIFSEIDHPGNKNIINRQVCRLTSLSLLFMTCWNNYYI